MAAVSADAPSRWLLSAVATLLTHGAVLLGTADAPRTKLDVSTPLWMSVVTSEQPGASAGPSAQTSEAGPSAVSPQPKVQARRRAPVARARPSASAHVATAEAPRSLAPLSPSSSEDGTGQAAPAGATGTSAGESAGTHGTGGLGSAGLGGGAPATRPALIATRNPCLGYFPAGASVDHGRVQIEVRVDESGHAAARAIMVEAPAGHDFGRAARACAAALRFAPARDALGVAVAADAKLELHFHRS